MLKEQPLSEFKDKDPIALFKAWLKEAQECPKIQQAEAMVLSTARPQILYGYSWQIRAIFSRHRSPPSWLSQYRNTLSSRVVLLKEVTEDSLIFYTNYKSLKSDQLKSSKSASLNFYWPSLNKQVRLEGSIKQTSREKSLSYWKTRSFESQISQYISQQSKPLESRELLEQKWESAKNKFQGQPVPCPPHWGGFAVQPYFIEFWREQPHRLHERLFFTRKTSLFPWKNSQKKTNQWISTLLYP